MKAVSHSFHYALHSLNTKNQLVNRDCMPSSGKGQHIMDASWAAFAFDRKMQMVKAEVSTLEMENVQPLTGQAVLWKQAAEAVLETVVATRVQCKQTLDGEPEYNESQFREENRVQLVRALPMWMPNWHNGAFNISCMTTLRMLSFAPCPVAQMRSTAKLRTDRAVWERIYTSEKNQAFYHLTAQNKFFTNIVEITCILP